MSILLKFSKHQLWLVNNKTAFHEHWNWEAVKETADFSRLKYGISNEDKLNICLAELLCPIVAAERKDLSEQVADLIKSQLRVSGKTFRDVESYESEAVTNYDENSKLISDMKNLDVRVCSIKKQTDTHDKSPFEVLKNQESALQRVGILASILDAETAIEQLRASLSKKCEESLIAVHNICKLMLEIYEVVLAAEKILHRNLGIYKMYLLNSHTHENQENEDKEISSFESDEIKSESIVSGTTKTASATSSKDERVQIGIRTNSNFPLPERRLARVSEYLLKIPYDYLKLFFVDKGLVTKKTLRRIEVSLFTDDGKIKRLLVNEVTPCLTSDIIPELAKHLETDFADVAEKLRTQPLFPEQVSPTQLSTLNQTFSLLSGIDKLTLEIKNMPESPMRLELQDYLVTKRIFYKKWIQLAAKLGQNSTFIRVRIKEHYLREHGLKVPNAQSMEEKKSLMQILIQSTAELLMHYKKTYEASRTINSELNSAKGQANLRENIVLKAMLDSGPLEYQWLLYISDGLKLQYMHSDMCLTDIRLQKQKLKNFEYLFDVSKYTTWSPTVQHFAKSFPQKYTNIECNSYGLTVWNRNFFKLKDSFTKLGLQDISALLVKYGAINLEFYRGLVSILSNPIQCANQKQNNNAEAKKHSNHDVMQILFQEISKDQDRKKNKATVEALLELNAKEMDVETVLQFMSQNALDNLGTNDSFPAGMRDPEETISEVKENVQAFENEALLKYSTARIKSVLRWITTTPTLGTSIDRCRELRDKMTKKIDPLWKEYIEGGGIAASEAEIPIESFNSISIDIKNGYLSIIEDLKLLQSERIFFPIPAGPYVKTKVTELLDAAIKSTSDEKPVNEWLQSQKKAIKDEALELEQATEMVSFEMFEFEVILLKAKTCCTIIDTVSQMCSTNGEEKVHGRESFIATQLEKTMIGRNPKKLAQALDLESDPDLTVFLTSNSPAYEKIYRCLEVWVEINRSVDTTISKLIDRLYKAGQVHSAEILEHYLGEILANKKKSTSKE